MASPKSVWITYRVLPNICVKFDSWLKNAAGPPASLAWTINARIMREKLVATCWEGVKGELDVGKTQKIELRCGVPSWRQRTSTRTPIACPCGGEAPAAGPTREHRSCCRRALCICLQAIEGQLDSVLAYGTALAHHIEWTERRSTLASTRRKIQTQSACRGCGHTSTEGRTSAAENAITPN